MNNIYYYIKHLLWGSMALGFISSCSQETETEHFDNDTPVSIISAYVQTRAINPEYVPLGNGTYYLNYQVTSPTSQSKELKVTFTDGIFEKLGKTDILWSSVNTDNGFTLSNSQDIKSAVQIGHENDNNIKDDIIWGQIKPATSYELSFTLSHRMAKVQVSVEHPDGWTVNEVCLEGLSPKYTFKNENGTVTAEDPDQATNLILTSPEADSPYESLLPPQERNGKGSDPGVLVVKVTKTGEDKPTTYKNILPYAMREEISSGQWSDVVLAFKAGHILNLTATIKGNNDHNIYFTYATLTDWTDKNGGIISVRPAGIYLPNDLEELIAAWNTTPKDETKLRKYGSKTEDKWTFTLWRSIDATSISSSFTDATTDNFMLTRPENTSYQITITSGQLGLSEGCYTEGIFVTAN